jgi:uncharacterized protein YndB with AHSA1/START domain
MSDIYHDLPIKAPIDRVLRAVSTPEGLDTWWTKSSSGEPKVGAEYELSFGPEYLWRARVTRCVPSTGGGFFYLRKILLISLIIFFF